MRRISLLLALFLFEACSYSRQRPDLPLGFNLTLIPDYTRAPWVATSRVTERWEEKLTLGEEDARMSLGYYREYINELNPDARIRLYYPFFSKEPLLLFWGVEGAAEGWAFKDDRGNWVRYIYAGWPALRVEVVEGRVKKIAIFAFQEQVVLREFENTGAIP